MAGDPWGELRAAAAALDLALPSTFEGQARTYLEVLARWERIGRLTGYATATLRVRHLLIESLMLLRAVPEPGTPLLDIGSGPGVPGLIVKLARPSWEVTLLEASRRRVNFLRDVTRQLGLTGVTVCEGRAEALGTGELAARFATATMRAVSRGRGRRARWRGHSSRPRACSSRRSDGRRPRSGDASRRSPSLSGGNCPGGGGFL